MSKKSKKRQGAAPADANSRPAHSGSGRKKYTAVALCALAPLAKEYVYAGGRLVATEESAPPPTPTPAGSPPSNPGALLASVSSAQATVSVSWSPL